MAHSAVLAKVDTEEGRRVVSRIPLEAVRPAKMLVDEAIAIVGRYAVVRSLDLAAIVEHYYETDDPPSS